MSSTKPTYAELEARVAKLELERLKYSTAFHSSPNLMLITSLEEGRVVEANDAFVAALGYGRDELIGFTTKDLGLWADVMQRDRFISALREGVGIRNVEVEVRTRPGERRVMLFSGEVVSLGGEPCLVSVASDITTRRRAEDELRESEAKFRTLAEQSPNMIFINQRGRVVYCNRRSEEVMGFTREELCAEDFDFLELFAPEHREAMRERYRRHLQGEDVVPYEHTLIKRDGTPVEVSISPRLIDYDGGEAILGVVTDISEHRRARAEQERLNAILEATSDMVSTATQDGRISYMNSAGCRLLGWDPDADYQGHRIRDAHPEWALEIIDGEGIPAAIRDGVWQGITALRLHDGSEVPCSQVIMSHRDAAGELAFLSTIIRDISRQRQAEVALRKARLELEDRVRERTAELAEANARLQREIAERREAEERLQLFWTFVEASADGMGWADLEGIIRYANPALCRMLDGTPDEVIGILVQKRYSEETQKRLAEEIFPRVLAQGSWTGEMELHSLQGRVRPTANSLFALRDAEGNPRMFANVVTDLTERKRAEEELRRHRDHLEDLVTARTAELRDSEQRYRLISENASDVIWTSDLSFRRTYISPSVKQVRGYTSEEALAQKPEEYIAPDSLAHLRAVLAEELAVEGQPEADPSRSRTLEVEMVHKDGSSVWVEMTASFLRDREQRPVGILGISRNITERKRMEREKVRLEEELRHSQKMEAVGRLAGGIAHDFNNILTAISGYAEMVQAGLGDGDPLQGDVDEIGKAAERAAMLTNQLLAFSRKQPMKPRVLQLQEVIAHSEKMLRRIIGEDIEMSIVHEDALWAIESDPGQIDQILVNLAVNSRDAMRSGGTLTIATQNVTVPGQVHVPGASSGDYVMMSVSDTGCGMDEATRKHIFEPFFTTKPTGEGTGLGLSTVYGLIRQNGGFVHVDSEPDRGTRFDVLLPRVQVKAAEAPPPAAAEAPGGTETVLLVEDEQMVRRLARRILERKGYTVLEASEGGAACLLSEKHQGEIQLLLTDVVMPQMSGVELYDRLRQQRPGLRALFMSGYTETTIPQSEIEETDFLAKPFTVDTLSRKVREVLGR
jgi:PAS domain S-box-containing protein